MVFFCVAACKSNKDGNYRGTWTRIHKDYSDLRLFDWSTVHYFPVTDFLFLLIVNVYSISLSASISLDVPALSMLYIYPIISMLVNFELLCSG